MKKIPLLLVMVLLVFPPGAAAQGARYPTGEGHLIPAYSKLYGADVIAPMVRFIGSLPHGREISKLSLYVGDAGEVAKICGGEADGCYNPLRSRIIASPEYQDGSTADEVLAHEYGHHIVSHRPGGAFGTPRWDVYEHVCELIQRGILLPWNIEGGYWRNPEEAFAQSYATLALPELAFEWFYTEWLEPTEGALARIRLDIEDPWAPGYAEARLRRSCHGGASYY